jgi:hypothetical protein
VGWVAIVDKSVHASDDIDIGDIDAVNIILEDQKKAARVHGRLGDDLSSIFTESV